MTRISEIPWVDYRLSQDAAAAYWTAKLRTPHGTQSLRSIQGAALSAACQIKQMTGVPGLAGFMRVGCGKTLTSGLLAMAAEAKRPMLLLPGGLEKDTINVFERLRLHWQIPTYLKIQSYQKIGHADHARDLFEYAPDLLICDEAHFLANYESDKVAATVARRVGDYVDAARKYCGFCWMTGSAVGKSLTEVAHLIRWALKDLAPVPHKLDMIRAWADCLDHGVEESTRRIRGDLSILRPHLGPSAAHSVEHAQSAFGSRLFHSPGVVMSLDAYVGSGLELIPIHLKHDARTDEVFSNLRELWIMPDGWILEEQGRPEGDRSGAGAFGVYRSARQCKLGFYYAHDPRPPEDWLHARQEHFANVRYILQNCGDTVDSAELVHRAIRAGQFPWAREAYERWIKIKPSFVPNTVARWFSRTALDECIKWGRARAREHSPSVVWIEHTEFGEQLSKQTGWRFFGAGGLDRNGESILDSRDMNIIASAANHEGKNLQYYADALMTSVRSGPKKMEQWLGRHHRDGQRKDTVHYYYLVGCKEDVEALSKAIELAHAVKRQSFEQEQKLCQARIIHPDPAKCKGPAYDARKAKVKNVA